MVAALAHPLASHSHFLCTRSRYSVAQPRRVSRASCTPKGGVHSRSWRVQTPPAHTHTHPRARTLSLGARHCAVCTWPLGLYKRYRTAGWSTRRQVQLACGWFVHPTAHVYTKRHQQGREKLTSSVTAIASGRRLVCFQTRDGRVASEGNGASAKPYRMMKSPDR